MDKTTLDLISNIVSLILLLASVFGFAFKGLISEWIKSRFSKAVSRELDTYKHELNRDLEAYKTSLIRELEQHKANIDIQRSIALKMAEARLDALRKLLLAFEEHTVGTHAYLQYSIEQKAKMLPEVSKASMALKAALSEAQIFLPIDLTQKVAQLHSDQVLAWKPSAPELGHLDPVLVDFLARSAAINLKLHELIFQPPPSLTARSKETEIFGSGST